MTEILRDEGYTVDQAATAKEALQKTQQTTYNLALIDYFLPDMNGTELLKIMKKTAPNTRKLMMTGYTTPQAASTEKPDGYLTKPMDLEKLLKTIKNQLQFQKNKQNSTNP